MKPPSITVGIPSHNRINQLTDCLGLLQHQTVIPAEILIIDNNLAPQYSSLVSKFPHLPIHLIHQPQLGKSIARNTILQYAKSEVIALLDDDSIPPPDWIERIQKIFSTQPDLDVLMGATREKSNSLLIQAYTFQYERFFIFPRVNWSTGLVTCGAILNTRNCAFRKSSVSNLKFDPRYDQFGFAEDTDFGEQLESHHKHMLYQSDLIVTHQEPEGILQLIQKKFLNGRAMARLIHKGIFHSYALSKQDLKHHSNQVTKLVKRYRFIEKILLLFYLQIILMSYRLGRIYENIVSATNRLKMLD